jgi:adenine-specific DNA-methyltransferase
LALLREFLSEDGTIWAFLDDNEIHAMRHVMDDLFGVSNFLNQISVKMKLTAGASGGGEDKKLKKNIEYILVYTRNKDGMGGFQKFNDVYDEDDLFEVIDEMEAEGKSWKYTSVLISTGDFLEERVIKDGAGDPIRVRKFKGVKRTTINALVRSGAAREEAYHKNFEMIFSDTNAQTSIRTRIIDEFVELAEDEILEAEYIPRSGRDKGEAVKHYYISKTIRRVIWLKDTATKRGKKLIKLEKAGTYWDGFPLNNLTKEGGVQFPQGKKPEALIRKVLELATNPGDLVLDSFLGSGTTAAVAHKTGRRWLGVELEKHAETLCVPRLLKVADGTDLGGITNDLGWKGGGGFRYVRLGDALFDEHGRINETKVSFADLARHVYFSETGEPLPKERVSAKTPLLGVHHGRAVYLLYNGILKDKSVDGGNVLATTTLEHLPPHDGPKVVYAAGCRFSKARLEREGITFKQTPYAIRIR